MDKFIIRGGRKLRGTVGISGAKNASLALMPAALLASGTFNLRNTPNLRDIATMSSLLKSMGMRIALHGGVLTLDTTGVNKYEAPYEHVKKMRASIYVLGPLVARYGRAKVSLPGGCAWGPRPVNLHLEGLKKLGAEVELRGGYIHATAATTHRGDDPLRYFQRRRNREHDDGRRPGPGNHVYSECCDRARDHRSRAVPLFHGARIGGIGTNRLEIEGVDELHPADVHTIPDRIEAGTFLVAAAMTGGSITLEGANPDHLSAVLARLEAVGCSITIHAGTIALSAPAALRPVDVTAAIYPGFPTDMQAQWIALMAVAAGDVGGDRHHLRRPVQTCAGAGAPGGGYRDQRQRRSRTGCEAAHRRDGHVHRPPRVSVADPRRIDRRWDDGSAPVSTTSTAATKPLRRNYVSSVRRSSGSQERNSE